MRSRPRPRSAPPGKTTVARGGASTLSPVCAYVADRSGSSLSEQQVLRLREVLAVRMSGRDEASYVEWLKSLAGASTLAELMAAIAVHKTDLFRDEVQLDAFSRHILKPLVATLNRPLHLWSAGCATGEEVATLLILLRDAGAHPLSTVLGTDISEGALKIARRQTFHPELFRRVPAAFRSRYFLEEKNGHQRLRPELHQQASFQRHNLMDRPYPIPPTGACFDVIFCRNVLIYFTDKAFDRTVDGLTERLLVGGTMILSAAEPILRSRLQLLTERFDQAFFYRRSDGSELPKPFAQPAQRVSEPLSKPMPIYASSSSSSGAAVRTMGVAAAPARAVAMSVAPVMLEVAAEDPRDEAARLFALVLDWAAVGEGDEDTEAGLRKCLYLDPHLAQARYLLGMLMEQRGVKADAASEYRRALAALTEGRSRATAFFLNDERLKTACKRALERLGYPR